MARELSAVLDHIATISELDLEDVPPTSHVVEVQEGLRADEPQPSLPREVALAAAPDSDGEGFRVPSGPADERPARADGRAGRRGRTHRRGRRRELWSAYRERAAPTSSTPSRGSRTRRRRHATARWAGVPLAVKDLFCTEGVPSQAGSRILEGYRPPYAATVVARLQPAGAPLLGKTNQDEFAMGSSNENSAYGPSATPGTARACPAARPAAAPPPWRPARRRGRSAPTPAARSASPRPCAGSSASSRPTARSRATG